jgi:potassium/chloride transporter 9
MSKQNARTPLLSTPGSLPGISEVGNDNMTTNLLQEVNNVDSNSYGSSGGESSNDTPSTEPTKNKLGALNGVFIPCCLNIMGIILFLRMGWGVGQAGILGTIAILAVAETMALLTVLSFSAIVTNGNMAGGGSYFMISRSLGPEFGGAIGILFYFAYAVGVSFYVVGFATEVQSTFYPDHDPLTVVRIVGTLGLFAALIISWIGAEAFAKFNTWFFVLQYGAIVWSIMSILSTKKLTMERLNNNLFPEFTDTMDGTKEVNSMCSGGMCNVQYVFAILFPAATGIMEGANLSGDLKNPSKAIPKGTILAVMAAIVTYLVLIFTLASGFERKELRTSMTVMQDAALISPYIVVSGILISALSSALGSLFGGSRVLQAIARDNLFPGLAYFGKGTAHGDEPRRAVVLTWVIAQCCVLVGNLDILAPVITSFFLISYALCNLTAFSLSVTGAPNFRPTFRYFSWHLSLLGFILCFGVMFYLNALNATVALVLLIGITIFLWFRHPATNWGDVSQALMYHQVRKYLLRLDVDAVEHSKFWRPSILLFVDDMRTDLIDFCRTLKKGGLLVLGNVLVGELEDLGEQSIEMRKNWLSFIQKRSIKAFPQVTVAPSLRVGYQFLMQGSGLGGLRCNTISLPFYNVVRVKELSQRDSVRNLKGPRSPSFYKDVGRVLKEGDEPTRKVIRSSSDIDDSLDAFEMGETKLFNNNSSKRSSNHQRHKSDQLRKVTGDIPVRDSGEYVGIIYDALMLEKNVLICRNFRDWSKVTVRGKKYIDVWFEDDWNGSHNDDKALMLQLATILTLKSTLKSKVAIRIFRLLNGIDDDNDDQIQKTLENQLSLARIPVSKVKLVRMLGENQNRAVVKGTKEYEVAFHELLLLYSNEDTSVIFLSLPSLPSKIMRKAYARGRDQDDAIRAGDAYLSSLERLTDNLSVALVRAGEKADMISTSI